ncbi:MAG: DNA mismatch repair endonuclease MutL [Clostridiales bacterium]|nr:DNA mismatch repair endonuclease MutL [Clostridiales bacterium]
MGIIKKLPPQLSDMIAAGEVVDRPSSVVKELFENAVDAGARAVTVEIKNGGLTYISVSDNGSGIARDDVRNAFLRHATSKISSGEDLESILTLGFRGEALAAISSVSRVELLTRTDGESEGTRILLEGGEIFQAGEAARSVGTTIVVMDLSFNTAARQKFVKSDRAEASAILASVQRLALSRPDVSVRYVRDGAEELRTPGDGRSDSCVYAVLGRGFSQGVLPISSESEGVIASGYVSKVSALRGNRNQQFFIVNGRCVKSKTLQAALEQAYRNRMFTGRFPACVIYIETGASKLDVNVHPAKTEIKFLFEKHVFDAVYYGAAAALDGDAAPQTISASDGAPPAAPKADFYAEDSGAHERIPGLPPLMRWDSPPNSPFVPVRSGVDVSPEPLFKSEAAVIYRPAQDFEQPDRAENEQSELFKTPSFRLVGEALGTYIVVECEESLWLIDKHAAHERMHFDRLRGGGHEPMPQTLLEPIIAAVGGDDADLLFENAGLLSELGFEVEDFGGGRVAVRQIPTSIEPDDAESALSEICAELGRGGDVTRRRDEIYASVACRAAIKAGRRSGELELLELAGRVVSGEIRHCPHGRPVAVEFTKSFIDKSFKRI